MKQKCLFSLSLFKPQLSVMAAALTLAACGGGESLAPQGDATAMYLVSQMAALPAAEGRKRALAATPDSIHATLDWAEWKYPTLFPKGPASFPLSHLGVNYTVRAYSTGNHLGITPDGAIWGLGPFTTDVLTPFGNVADYTTMVQADACQVNPGSCANPQPTGLNGCADPLWATLPAGHRAAATYDVESQEGNGEMNFTFEVVGQATFNGQATTQITYTSNIRLLVNTGVATVTANSDSRIDKFVQPLPNGFWQELTG